MKYTLIVICLLFFGGLSAHDFESKFYDIKRLAKNVWEENDLNSAESDASNLIDEIDEYLDDEPNLTTSEKNKLRLLKKNVRDVKDFITQVLQGRSFFFDIDKFQNASSLIGGSTTIINSAYKVKFVKFELNGLAVLLAWNDSKSVGYDMVIENAEIGGFSTSTYTSKIGKYSCRPINNNRENRNVHSWKIISVSLKEWIGYY